MSGNLSPNESFLPFSGSWGISVTKEEEFRSQAALCLERARTAKDPSYKLALLEMAQWWAFQADRVQLAGAKSDPLPSPSTDVGQDEI
jgi:hypothetical protein